MVYDSPVSLAYRGWDLRKSQIGYGMDGRSMWMRVEVYVLSSGCGDGDVDVGNSEAFSSCSSALLGE